MSTTKRRLRRRHLLAIAALLGLLAAACSNSGGSSGGTASPSGTAASGSTGTTAPVDLTQKVELTDVPGVTDDAINYAILSTETNNVLGTCVMQCYRDGIEAYFNWRNSEGGIYGRKLVASKIVDDEFANHQVHALEIATANDTFGTFSATNLATGLETLNDAGIPTYVWSIAPAEQTGKQNVFGQREVVCVECTRRAVAYVAQLAGAKKVAALGYGVSDVSKVCAKSTAESIDQYGPDSGGATVAYTNDTLGFGLPNGIGPEVTAMKEAGVDLIVACIDLNGMKTLGQELERQGMQDVTLYHANSYDSDFVSSAGDIFEGDYVQAAARPFESESGSSNLDTFKEWMAKDGKSLTEISMVGWINADLAYEGLVAAGPDFSREKVIAATNTFTDYTATGLTQPVDWTRQHQPWTQDDMATYGPKQDCIALVQIKDSKFVVVGDRAKPWSCWPGSTTAWSEPTPTDFP